MTPNVDVKVEDGIGWLTLRKPESRNAIDAAFVEEAISALDQTAGRDRGAGAGR